MSSDRPPTHALIAEFTKTPVERQDSPPKDNVISVKELRDSSWADGLRGISAVFVMCSHLSLSFARYIVRPSDGPGQPIAWMQLPILRLVIQGPAWVAMFFVLSGFVNGLKPLQLIREGDIEGGLLNLSVSSFRRPFRLVLPATAATIVAWLLAQLGAFELGRQSEAYWIRITSPKASPTWLHAFVDLSNALRTTWMYSPHNPYDQPQWAMVYLLQGSFMVVMVLLLVANLTTRFRITVVSLSCYLSLNLGKKLGDPLVGLNVFAGLLLAELYHSEYPARLAQYSRTFVAPASLLALILMSFPGDFQSYTPWSRVLMDLFNKIPLEPDWAEISRFWPSVGVQILVTTVILSPDLRRALSHPWLRWLGKISFPLYLLHGMFMRSLLSWLLFSKSELQLLEEGNIVYAWFPLPGILTFLFAMPVFLFILFTSAHIWTEKMEPVFGLITTRAEKLMFGKAERQPALPLRSD